VKAKHRVLRYTDSIMRYDAEHERAGRRTGAINNDLFAGVTKRHIARPIGADIAAAIICYADDGGSGLRQPPNEHRGKRYCQRDTPTEHKFTVFYASN